jgi:hypothetical protein
MWHDSASRSRNHARGDGSDHRLRQGGRPLKKQALLRPPGYLAATARCGTGACRVRVGACPSLRWGSVLRRTVPNRNTALHTTPANRATAWITTGGQRIAARQTALSGVGSANAMPRQEVGTLSRAAGRDPLAEPIDYRSSFDRSGQNGPLAAAEGTSRLSQRPPRRYQLIGVGRAVDGCLGLPLGRRKAKGNL